MTSRTIAASIEVAPKHVLEMRETVALIPAGTRVYITDVATHPVTDIAQSCQILADASLVAVPHLPARRIRNGADLEDRVRRYTDAGAFLSALAAVREGRA